MQNEELPFDPVADPTLQTIEITAQVVRQPVGDMYIASVDSKIITRISHFDVRRIQKEAREVETYLGIQRPLDEKRVNQIGEYVNFQDASFPSAIILALDSDYSDYDPETGKIKIRNFRIGETKPTRAMKDIARVLDGQHRIAGLEHFDKERVFEVIATFFIGADISDQAYIFATVNLEQRKVNRSLGYDLFALAKSRSPERTCHNIAVTFDKDAQSPFHRRIKRLGTATPERDFETLTQATFVDGLLQHISRTPKADRDALLRNRPLTKPSPDERRRLILRHFFLTDESDLEIARIFDAYFRAVKARWPTAWDARGYGTMLNRTNGYRALCRFLRPCFLKYSDGTQSVGFHEFTKVFGEIRIDDAEFTIDNFPAGTSGESKLYNRLLDESGLASLAVR